MTTAVRLYTPEILGLATTLARYPLSEGLTLRGDTRSPTCGSSLAIGLDVDPNGGIAALGMRVHACAIGQAAAAIFAEGAAGRDRAAIATAEAELTHWLVHEGPPPQWPGLAVLEPARAYPARHGAIRLAWRAALAALPTG